MIYVIYKIYCLDNQIDYTYIGHTKSFNTRKSQHKRDCCKETLNHNFPIYQIIRQHGGWNNWNMIPIEQLDCELIEAKIREQYWIEQQKNKLNTKVAFISEEDQKIKDHNDFQEYYYSHQQEILDKKKIWRDENKDKIKKNNEDWYEKNKEKRKIYNAEYRKTLTTEQKEKHNKSKRDKYKLIRNLESTN